MLSKHFEMPCLRNHFSNNLSIALEFEGTIPEVAFDIHTAHEYAEIDLQNISLKRVLDSVPECAF